MKFKSLPLGIAVLVIMFGGILISMQLNWWKTESERVPATFNDGEFAGEYNPADIRGSYSFGDINEHFNVPLRDLRVAFGVPEGVDVAQFKAKDLEMIYSDLAEAGYEIGTNSVRLFVAMYIGVPFEPGEETYLSSDAVEILITKAELSDDQIAYLEAHQVDISADTVAGDEEPDTVESEELEPADAEKTDTTNDEKPDMAADHVEGEGQEGMVRGPTTFQNVLDWGVTQERVEEIIGGPMPNALVTIREHCFENGLEFGVIKLEMQEAVDQAE
jgi:hypothetical protein